MKNKTTEKAESFNEELPDDWELEMRVFHACGNQTPVHLQELLRDLWKAYCMMEIRAITAEEQLV